MSNRARVVRRTWKSAGALALGTWLGMVPVAAEDALAPSTTAVARFPIADSPIQLTGDVRPRQFLGIESRRAAWLGTETGDAEIWIHPLKVIQDFHLAFRVPQYLEPIPASSVARTVHVRPEVTTIVYAHQSFTVRQHVVAPLDEAAVLVLLDVDTTVPLEVNVAFRSVLQYAWPGGLGGQYASWDGGTEGVPALREPAAAQRLRRVAVGGVGVQSACALAAGRAVGLHHSRRRRTRPSRVHPHRHRRRD